MSEISEISFLARIDKAISSYFEDKPALWSYDSFLEKMKPLIMEDENVAELSALWRKRFLTALKKISNDEKKDEQKLIPTNTRFWKKAKMEKNRISSEAKLQHKKSIFIFNSQIDALDVLEIARTLQTVQATNELDQHINTTTSNNVKLVTNEVVEQPSAECSNILQRKDDESNDIVLQESDKNKVVKRQASELQTKAKKTKVVIDLTQDDNMEDRRLLLKERQLEIEEREIKLEREKLELLKLKRELNIQ
nr:2726_t:CDS:2 [Entrophospora candida]